MSLPIWLLPGLAFAGFISELIKLRKAFRTGESTLNKISICLWSSLFLAGGVCFQYLELKGYPDCVVDNDILKFFAAGIIIMVSLALLFDGIDHYLKLEKRHASKSEFYEYWFKVGVVIFLLVLISNLMWRMFVG